MKVNWKMLRVSDFLMRLKSKIKFKKKTNGSGQFNYCCFWWNVLFASSTLMLQLRDRTTSFWWWLSWQTSLFYFKFSLLIDFSIEIYGLRQTSLSSPCIVYFWLVCIFFIHHQMLNHQFGIDNMTSLYVSAFADIILAVVLDENISGSQILYNKLMNLLLMIDDKLKHKFYDG